MFYISIVQYIKYRSFNEGMKSQGLCLYPGTYKHSDVMIPDDRFKSASHILLQYYNYLVETLPKIPTVKVSRFTLNFERNFYQLVICSLVVLVEHI